MRLNRTGNSTGTDVGAPACIARHISIGHACHGHGCSPTQQPLQPIDICQQIVCMCVLCCAQTGPKICRVGCRSVRLLLTCEEFHVVVPISTTLALFSLLSRETNLEHICVVRSNTLNGVRSQDEDISFVGGCCFRAGSVFILHIWICNLHLSLKRTI